MGRIYNTVDKTSVPPPSLEIISTAFIFEFLTRHFACYPLRKMVASKSFARHHPLNWLIFHNSSGFLCLTFIAGNMPKRHSFLFCLLSMLEWAVSCVCYCSDGFSRSERLKSLLRGVLG
jgi:hypothetical protein